ncbi:hypothetical protein FG386_002204 [Cryptosporidium ryanae]|uniref:uncharacterized protein n=1 Tax=Cryptosporidium ryanae TaxID=515981 RepID=UPI00351A9189|nr:hypothetical protein FG386_002204 [Cryptosporidium ryanae]
MSTENLSKNESELASKSILSPVNKNRTLLLKKNELTVKKNDMEVSDLSDNIGEENAPLIKVTHVESVNSNLQEGGGAVLTPKNESLNKSIKKDLSLTKNSVSNLNGSRVLGLTGKVKEKKVGMQSQFLKLKNSELPNNSVNMDSINPNMMKTQNYVGGKPESLTTGKMNMKGSNMYNDYLDLASTKFVPTKKSNINNRSGLFGHEPNTYTTNPLVIEDLIDELEEKAKNYFIMFSKERKEREKLERQCYWMQEENKTLQVTLKSQISTIQGLQNKIIDLRGNPSVITETIERIDMLYTQLDTLIQAFAGVCSYITFNEPKDRREIIELVLEYLHPCRGLDLRLNSLYGSIYYFKLGIVKELPPPIQPPEKIPGYDVWQPPIRSNEKITEETVDNSKLPPHMQQGNSLSKVAESYMKGNQNLQTNADTPNADDSASPKIMSPVASTKQLTIPVNSSQVSGDTNIPLTGFEITIKSVQRIEQVGDGNGKLFFVARIDSESAVKCKNNPVRKSKEFEYNIDKKDGKGSIEEEFKLVIDSLPPKSSGLLPRFTIDMWDTSNPSEPIGHASKTFIDPSTLLPEQVWEVFADDGEKLIANIILTVNPKPGDSMLPAGRFIVAKEAKGKTESNPKKESKLSRLSFRGEKEKGIDKMNAILRPGINLLRKVSNNEASNNQNKAGSGGNSKSLDIKSASSSIKDETLNKVSKSLTVSPVSKESAVEPLSVDPNAKISISKSVTKSTVAPLPATSKSLEKSLKDSTNESIGTVKSSAKSLEVANSSSVESASIKSSETVLKKSSISLNTNESKSIPNIVKTSITVEPKITEKVKVDPKKVSVSVLPKKASLQAVNKSSPNVPNEQNQVKVSSSEKVSPPALKKDDNNFGVKVKIPSVKVEIEPKVTVVKAEKISKEVLGTKSIPKNGVPPLTNKVDIKANIPTIKKMDIKGPSNIIKPKNPVPVINIKKQGNVIAIKPKVLVDGPKNAITITPKIVATPPKSVFANKAGAANQTNTGKEDIKIMVTKGATNITPKIIPKVKIVPKAK